MWMMSCSGFRQLNNMHDLSPEGDHHISKPSNTSSTATSNITKNPNITTCTSRTTPFTNYNPLPIATNMLPPYVNHHPHQNHQVLHDVTSYAQGSSRSTNNMDVKDHHQDEMLVPQRSSRWNPTPEQLLVLEDLYRRGTKTPTAQQTHQITELLRKFGKVEDKNVFYWFQNHRARERQKHRRQEQIMNNIMSSQSQSQSSHSQSNSKHKQTLINSQSRGLQIKDSAAGPMRTSTNHEAEQKKRTQFSRAAMAERRTPGWIKYEKREVQQRMMNTIVILNSTHFPPQTSYYAHANPLCPKASYATYLDTKAHMDYSDHYYTPNYQGELADAHQNRETTGHQTLELFPLQSDNLKGVNINITKDTKSPIMRDTGTADFMASDHFMEFL